MLRTGLDRCSPETEKHLREKSGKIVYNFSKNLGFQHRRHKPRPEVQTTAGKSKKTAEITSKISDYPRHDIYCLGKYRHVASFLLRKVTLPNSPQKPMRNTQLNYRYRNAPIYKQFAVVVFPNPRGMSVAEATTPAPVDPGGEFDQAALEEWFVETQTTAGDTNLGWIYKPWLKT